MLFLWEALIFFYKPWYEWLCLSDVLCLWRWCECLYFTTVSFLCLCLWSISFCTEWSFFASKKSHLDFTFYQKRKEQLLNRNLNMYYKLKLRISSSPPEALPKIQDAPLSLVQFRAIISYTCYRPCVSAHTLRMEAKNYWVDNGRGYHSYFKSIHARKVTLKRNFLMYAKHVLLFVKYFKVFLPPLYPVLLQKRLEASYNKGHTTQ